MEIYSMPALASKFNTLQNIVVNLIVARGVSVYGMTAPEVTAIVAYRTTWAPLQAAATNKMSKNKDTTIARDENQALYMPALVLVFDKHLVNNDAISAADKAALGIHTIVISSSPIPDPTQAPGITITYGASLQHIINLRNTETGKRGKPKGVGFVELWYKIGDPAPAGLIDANMKANINKSGQTITYLLSQKGLTVYFFARWVTKKGGYGPWGAFFSAVIA